MTASSPSPTLRNKPMINPQPISQRPGRAIIFRTAIASPICCPGIAVPACQPSLGGRQHAIELRLATASAAYEVGF